MNQEQNFKPTCENMEIGDIQEIQDIQEMEIGDDQKYIQEEEDDDDEEEEEDEEVVEGLEFCGTFIRREQIDEMKQFFEDEITKELLAAQEQVRAAQQKVNAVYRRLRNLDVMSDKEILELVRR